MINSKQKGNRFEREVANMFKEHGYEARRGQQFCGINGDADVVGVDGIHIEAKHCNQMRLYDWMAQSKRDAKEGEKPIVIHKKDRGDVLVTMRFTDWIELFRAYDVKRVLEWET